MKFQMPLKRIEQMCVYDTTVDEQELNALKKM